jgi:hypothetical protein
MSEINELAAALVKAQAELRNPKLDSTNPHFRSKFASLAEVRDTITPVLTKHGISVIQNLVTNEHGVGCETILIHSSGQMLRLGPLYLPASKHDPQGFGSCATYARRYALMASVNVVGDEDDDANAGTDAHRRAVEKEWDGSQLLDFSNHYKGKPWRDTPDEFIEWCLREDNRLSATRRQMAMKEKLRRQNGAQH